MDSQFKLTTGGIIGATSVSTCVCVWVTCCVFLCPCCPTLLLIRWCTAWMSAFTSSLVA